MFRTALTRGLTLVTTVTQKKYDWGVWRGRIAAAGAIVAAVSYSMAVRRIDWAAVGAAATAIVAACSPDARDPSGVVRAVPPTVTEKVESTDTTH